MKKLIPMAQFDLGLYFFRRQVGGPICPKDDLTSRNGEVVAVLHPMQNVDPAGLYCFGVAKSDGHTKTLVRKNLRFSKVVTLSFDRAGCRNQMEEVHAKLNVAVKYLSEARQLCLEQEADGVVAGSRTT